VAVERDGYPSPFLGSSPLTRLLSLSDLCEEQDAGRERGTRPFLAMARTRRLFCLNSYLERAVPWFLTDLSRPKGTAELLNVSRSAII